MPKRPAIFQKFALALVIAMPFLRWERNLSSDEGRQIVVDRVRNSKCYKLISERKGLDLDTDQLNQLLLDKPGEFVKALLAYLMQENVSSATLQLKGIDLLLLARHDVVRCELVKYLSLRPDGALEKFPESPEQPIERQTVGMTAHYLLRLVDSVGESPYRLMIYPAEWKNKTYGLVLRDLGKVLPEALVEYLFEEFPNEAWDVFRGHELAQCGSESTKLKLEQIEFAGHLIETTAWRIRRGYKQFAEIRSTHQELERLVNDTAWYSRRYVVHVLLKYPFFRTPELVKRLQEDKHPLVRDRAKFISLADR